MSKVMTILFNEHERGAELASPKNTLMVYCAASPSLWITSDGRFQRITEWFGLGANQQTLIILNV